MTDEKDLNAESGQVPPSIPWIPAQDSSSSVSGTDIPVDEAATVIVPPIDPKAAPAYGDMQGRNGSPGLAALAGGETKSDSNLLGMFEDDDDSFPAHALRVRKRKPVALIVVLSVVAVVLLALIAYCVGGQFYFKDKAAPGVRLGTMSVAGQTRDQLKSTVENAVKDSSVDVGVDGGTAAVTASLQDLGVTVDVDKTVDALLNANKDNWFLAVNPLAHDSVGLQTSIDKMALSDYLSQNLIGDDARVVNASISYDANADRFVTSSSRAGQSPVLDPVIDVVDELIAQPGSSKHVSVTMQVDDAPIGDDAANQAAADANARLANALTISNGKGKKFTIPSTQIGQWIKPKADPQQGVITLDYDQDAIASYLADTLPKELNQDMVAEENVVNTAGTVITTDVKGVDGVSVNDTSGTAQQVLDALRNGTPAEINADVTVTEHETKSRTVRYDVPDGDPHMVINLSEQKAYAYKGTTLVNTFNVSTGKSSTPTDTGTFFVHTKYQTQTMRGGEGADAYVTPNVPWVTYYNGGEGFHGAPWNIAGINSGTPKSHGCTNMFVDDAKWVYDFMPVGAMVEVVGSTPSGAVR